MTAASGRAAGWVRRPIVWLCRLLAVVGVAAAAIVVAGLVDGHLAGWQPHRLSPTSWLWLRWFVSVAIALAIAALSLRGRRLRLLRFAPLAIVILVAVGRPAYAAVRSIWVTPKPIAHADLNPLTRMDVLLVARRTLDAPVDAPPPPLDREPWNGRWSVELTDGEPAPVVLDAASRREAVVDALSGLRNDHGTRVRWRADARHVVLLDPHTLPTAITNVATVAEAVLPASVDHFVGNPGQLAPADAEVVLLLKASDPPAASRVWRAWAAKQRVRVVTTSGAGVQTLADVAWTAAIGGPDDGTDVALAWRFRPVLLLHSSAAKREGSGYFPASVDDFLADDKPQMCRDTGTGQRCRTITRADEVDGSYDFFDTGATRLSPTGRKQGSSGVPGGTVPPSPPTAPPGATQPPGLPPLGTIPSSPTTPAPSSLEELPAASCHGLPPGIPPPPTCAASSPMYWHVGRHDGDIYIGYWWFFPFNPTPVINAGACHPLVGIPDLECFDHASDWEGVTVVVRHDAAHRVFRPIAVIYEQHGTMMRRSWAWLRRHWGARSVGSHALVYVAAGSHASYPTPCSERAGHYCGQPPLHPSRPDGPHDGGLPWPNSPPSSCSALCLIRLPATADGRPALWAAFPGVWGRRVCILWGAVCTQTTAPKSPGMTSRFEQPWSAPTIAG